MKKSLPRPVFISRTLALVGLLGFAAWSALYAVTQVYALQRTLRLPEGIDRRPAVLHEPSERPMGDQAHLYDELAADRS
jgi:hypothetical protein